jgi:hypothetical protein
LIAAARGALIPRATKPRDTRTGLDNRKVARGWLSDKGPALTADASEAALIEDAGEPA